MYRFVIGIAVACASLLPLGILAQEVSTGDQGTNTISSVPSGPSLQNPQIPSIGSPARININNNEPLAPGSGVIDTGASVLSKSPEESEKPIGEPGKPIAEPAALNEFQRFVLEATGNLLPIYGADFFSSNSLAPAPGAPVPDDYLIGPGDEVIIRGWGTIDIDYHAVVDRNGLINIPHVGIVSLTGIKAANVEGVIRAAIGKNYHGFQLNVTLGRLRGITIYMVGQAKRPGTYTVSSLSTIVTALSESGGVNPNGSLRHVQLKRAGRLVAEVDLYAFLAKGDQSADMRLIDGDIIVIPPKVAEVALTGEVERPSIYELRGADDDLRDVLDIAGGLPVVADPRRAFLERIDPEKPQPRTVEELSLDETGLSKKLRNGDLISVVRITPEFANAVTLRGSVSPTLRVPYRSGMRVTDLIPNREFLGRAVAVRRQNYALIAKENLVASVGNLYDEINWDYAVVERVNHDAMVVNLIPFDLGNALSDPKGPDNVFLQPGDIVTVFSANDIRVPIAKRQVFITIEGEVKYPGVYQVSAGENLINVLLKAGGLTSDAYLFGAEFDRESVRKDQQKNIDKVVDRLQQQFLSEEARLTGSVSSDPQEAQLLQTRLAAEKESRDKLLQRMREITPTGRISLGLAPSDTNVAQLPDLRLENGDRFVVPNRPDFVQIYGSVNTESSLLWQPGKTVSDYLAHAGLGPDSDKDAIFVMRADGSVVSNSGRWLTNVSGVVIYPGDTIVVPEKTDRETFWAAFGRYLKDYTQIFANLGLGVAAIHVLNE